MRRNRIWTLVFVVALITVTLNLGSWAHADEEVTIIGILEKSKRGVVVSTNEESYLILGQDLSGLVGRRVKVVGEVIESRRGKSLKVSVVEIHRS